jgi:hypothetical protein
MKQDDLFDKLDALLEKRASDVLVDKGLESGDFPLMTEVVDAPPPPTIHSNASPERRGGDRRDFDRRQGDRRLGDRRLGGRRENDPNQSIASRPVADDPQMEALLSAMERRLADLFIRQQLRMEDAMRKTLLPEAARFAPDLEGQLQAMEKRLRDDFTRQQLRTEDVLKRAIQNVLDRAGDA